MSDQKLSLNQKIEELEQFLNDFEEGKYTTKKE